MSSLARDALGEWGEGGRSRRSGGRSSRTPPKMGPQPGRTMEQPEARLRALLRLAGVGARTLRIVSDAEIEDEAAKLGDFA